MVKFLLGVAIVAFSSYCGFVFAKKYRKRKLFFGQLKEFNDNNTLDKHLYDIDYVLNNFNSLVLHDNALKY